MKTWLLILMIGSISNICLRADIGESKVIIGYVFCEDRLLRAEEIAAEKMTHINYAFADIREGKMVEGFARDAENLVVLRSLKSRNPNLKILISVGGWTWSGAFSDMALTAKSRKVFVESACGFLERHQLDGLDIDWEYPGLPGYGNTHRPEDRENFTALMRECRRELNRLGKRTGKLYLLTAAVGAFPDFLAHTEMGKTARYLDLVNLMTYDFAEAEADPLTTHHACLQVNPKAPKPLGAAPMVEAFIKAGVPPEKLVLGVPFYGRAWGEVDDVNNGLFRPGKEAEVKTSYRAIAGEHLQGGGYIRYWDESAQAPFLYHPEKRVFISYEDPESLAKKCFYVAERSIRGIMFWAYGSDGNELLDVIHRSLRQAQ